jgi:2-polyprenyl-3-methyl-5-hydroxy-6-metoxy-1,4-benzoquinol methylase
MHMNTCPVCRSQDSEIIHNLACGNLDNSKLYSTVRLKICRQCGHAFNELSRDELMGLIQYYNDEYAPANLSTQDTKGDRPGSGGNLTSARYEQLCNVLMPHIQKKHEILDVGCAMGGFLDYMSKKGVSRLSGVDMTEKYVEEAKIKKNFRIEQGNAESLPFANHTFDVVVMEQVMEHLVNPLRAFQEARRVLKKDGVFCIGVPDASRYADFYFFDYYWLLLREHIQHFDVEHLNLLAMQEGFMMLECHQTVHAVMSERMIMPNLYVIFRVCDFGDNKNKIKPNDCRLRQHMVNYIDKEKSRQLIKSRKIAELSKSGNPVYAWGIGREFLYLYESAGLKNCNIVGLIDMNQLKQKFCSVNGMKIVDGDVLRKSSTDSVLLITAIAHTDSIMHTSKALEFKGDIFDLNINSTSL